MGISVTRWASRSSFLSLEEDLTEPPALCLRAPAAPRGEHQADAIGRRPVPQKAHAASCVAKGALKFVMAREVIRRLKCRCRRRAPMTARFCRRSLQHESRPQPLPVLRQRLREQAHTRVRSGYRQCLVLVQREGRDVGRSRLQPVYTEDGIILGGDGPGATRPPEPL